MRKTIYSLVVAAYILLSSGVVVQLHYCMDRLQEIGLFADGHEGPCSDCGMEMNDDNDCCQDRTEVIKLVQDQSIQQAPVPSFKNISQLPRAWNEQVDVSEWNISPDRGRCVQNHSFDQDRYRYRLLSVFRV